MKRVLVSASALLAVAACGCDRGDRGKIVGSGVARTEMRELGDFDELELHVAGRIEIGIGALKPLEVTADDNIIGLLKSEVRGRRLVVELAKPIRPKVGVVLKATVPDLKVLSCDGAFKVILTGLRNESLLIELDGAGMVTAGGETNLLTISATGAGSIDVGGLQARNVDINVTGAGHVDTHATEKLNVAIAGTGVVRYSGDPELQKRIDGFGVVTKK